MESVMQESSLLVCLLCGLVAVICFGFVRNYVKRGHFSALMDLAEAVNGPTPKDLSERAEMISKLKAQAQPPLTPEEELARLDCSPVERFKFDDPEFLRYLDEHGYVVVDVGLSESRDKLAKLKSLLWDFLEASTPSRESKGWKRDDPSTWDNEGMCSIGSCTSGIINGKGAGHSEFNWEARTIPAVRKVFELIWGEEDLITSFDGANVFRPWHPDDPATCDRKTFGGWWHVDQGRRKAGARHAVQGLLSLFDQNETTGGLCVMPGSQFRHDEVVLFNTGTRDFVTVQPYFPGFHDMPRKLVSCKAGDLVLWDSRTIHCNTPAPKPLPPKAKGLFRLPAPELLRACAYICITPRRMASAEVLRLRRCAFEAQITSSHWPHEVYLGSAGDENQPKLDINSCGQARRLLI